MKNPTSRSMVFRLVLLCAGVFTLGFLQGCQKESAPKEEKQNLVSIDNLQTAYGVSVKRSAMYERFIPRAEKEKFRGVAALYKALARSEGIQADVHAGLIRQHGQEPAAPAPDSVVVGTTMQTLKMAISSEELEYSSMYPNLLRTATLENFTEGVDQFTMMQSVEERHVELLKDAQAKMGKIDTKYFVCPGCGYNITSDKTEECPVCKKPKTTFEKI
jgi:rubrerythrin